MFEATAALGGLEIQLVFYRGFYECKASRWMTTAADLHRVMRSVSCVGGETQIERVLAHAIAETRAQRVNALVFVGDAMEEKVDRLCRLAGELGLLGVPIFLFHEGRDRPRQRPSSRWRACRAAPICSFDLRERRPPQGTARRRRGLCRRRLSRADRLRRQEGRRGAAPDRATARVSAAMLYLFGGFAVLGGCLLLVYLFVNADPARLARGLKWTGIVIAVAAGRSPWRSPGRLAALLMPPPLLMPLLIRRPHSRARPRSAAAAGGQPRRSRPPFCA